MGRCSYKNQSYRRDIKKNRDVNCGRLMIYCHILRVIPLFIFLCPVTDYFDGKAKGQRECNGFPYGLICCCHHGHHQAEKTHYYSKCIFFGEILFHHLDFRVQGFYIRRQITTPLNISQWISSKRSNISFKVSLTKCSSL
jgi:hypothetical protein